MLVCFMPHHYMFLKNKNELKSLSSYDYPFDFFDLKGKCCGCCYEVESLFTFEKANTRHYTNNLLNIFTRVILNSPLITVKALMCASYCSKPHFPMLLHSKSVCSIRHVYLLHFCQKESRNWSQLYLATLYSIKILAMFHNPSRS